MHENKTDNTSQDPEVAFFASAIKSGGIIDFDEKHDTREKLRVSGLLKSGWIIRRDDGRYDVGPAAMRAVMESNQEANQSASQERELAEIKNALNPKS